MDAKLQASRERPHDSAGGEGIRRHRVRFSVRVRAQNASFRRVRFFSPAQTWRPLTEKRILGVSPSWKSALWADGSRKTAVWECHLHGKVHSVIPRSRRMRFSVTSRRPGGVGQPPARLRGTMENGSTGQMRSSNPPPGCGAGCAGVRRSRFGVWPHGKAHSAQPVGSRMRFSVTTRPQNALFREGPCTECAFP